MSADEKLLSSNSRTKTFGVEEMRQHGKRNGGSIARNQNWKKLKSNDREKGGFHEEVKQRCFNDYWTAHRFGRKCNFKDGGGNSN